MHLRTAPRYSAFRALSVRPVPLAPPSQSIGDLLLAQEKARRNARVRFSVAFVAEQERLARSLRRQRWARLCKAFARGSR